MSEYSDAADQARQLAKAYMRRTGMSPNDFARRVGYQYVTLGQFLSGKYRRGAGSKERFISEAILRFLGTARAVTESEFHGKLYEIGNVRAMRDVFRRLCKEPCILLAYAPPGSGKTDVARALIPEFRGKDVEVYRIYCREGINRRDMLNRISVKCGSVGNISIERVINNLRYDFAGRRAALYFDEAQHLSVECLETVREFYDEMRWSLCFAGSHQLDQIFTKWAGNLEQLERRVTEKVYLPSVTQEEAEQIIRAELPDLKTVKVRTLIEHSYVHLKKGEQYLSIGRVMGCISELRKLAPPPKATGSIVIEMPEAK